MDYVISKQCYKGTVLQRNHGSTVVRRHYFVSLSKKINPSLVLVQPRKTCPFINERLLMGRKESNQTNKQRNHVPRQQPW